MLWCQSKNVCSLDHNMHYFSHGSKYHGFFIKNTLQVPYVQYFPSSSNFPDLFNEYLAS